MQLLCSINFNTNPDKHERRFGIGLLLHIKWLITMILANLPVILDDKR
jgi:hypothetical protein